MMDDREKEIKLLEALEVLGVKWLARDSDGYLGGYVEKPMKKTNGMHIFWIEPPESSVYDFNGLLEKFFAEIKHEDSEPMQISDLLAQKIGDNLKNR